MTEKEEEIPAYGNNEDSPPDQMSEFRKLRSEIFEKMNKLSAELEEIKKIAEKSGADNEEKLQSIENLVSRTESEAVMEMKDMVASTDPSSSLTLNNPTEKTPEIAKSFVLKHVFENAETFEIDKRNLSQKEDHFGVKWFIELQRNENFLEFHLHVTHHEEKWEIKTEFDLKIIGPKRTDFTKTLKYCFKKNVGHGYREFLRWEEMMENYLVDGNLTAEIHVKIIETKGLRKEKIRSFDESVKEVSDMVLVVKDRKFHVLKTFLAAQSSFFKALLLGNFSESKESEVNLTGIDPEDFHFLLEVLYGEPAVDETNVEGIALLADMYDAPTAIRRCEEFMIEKSQKNLKRKLQMADQYHLSVLKKRSLADIKTTYDIMSVLPDNIEDLEHSTMAALLEKSIRINA